MAEQYTFKIANSNNTYTILAQNEALIKTVVTPKNGVLSNTDITKLRSTAAIAGDEGILEFCDLKGPQKLEAAKLNNFEEYYDMELSEDEKTIKITVKSTILTSNPNLGTIITDFGIGHNVLVKKGGIPYGNERIINERLKNNNEDRLNYDNVVLEAGDTLNLPVEKINITGTPRGFWGRLFQ